MPKIHRTEAAVLLHGIGWTAPTDVIPLAAGVSLHRYHDAPVAKLYEALCADVSLDDGERLLFDAYARVVSSEDYPSLINAGDLFSPLDLLCNIIVVALGCPMRHCRVIWSSDQFATASRHALLYEGGRQIEFLQRSNDWPCIDAQIGGLTGRAWTRAAWLHEENPCGRLARALTAFARAWRADYLEEIGFHLGTALHLLFSPSGASGPLGTALSTARYCEAEPEVRRQVFRQLECFLRLHNRLARGKHPCDLELSEIVPPAFRVVAAALRLILSDSWAAHTFNDEEVRAEYLESLLCGNR